MSSVTITEFLLARFAEDEAAAHECARLFPSPWEIADRGWRVRIYSADVPLSLDVGEPGDVRTPCVIEVEPTYAHDGWLSDNVQHIARHDPARVLAECAAKRRIVEMHKGEHECVGFLHGRFSCVLVAPGYQYEVDPTLSLMALPYANHPDYDEVWRS